MGNKKPMGFEFVCYLRSEGGIAGLDEIRSVHDRLGQLLTCDGLPFTASETTDFCGTAVAWQGLESNFLMSRYIGRFMHLVSKLDAADVALLEGCSALMCAVYNSKITCSFMLESIDLPNRIPCYVTVYPVGDEEDEEDEGDEG